jgi:NADPH-dependent 2,4-dienoyl-CoA reductase/sulfur reductase-like enzyme
MNRQSKRLVVIGGGTAGISAALATRRLQPDWEVVILERGPYVSFVLGGLPYLVAGVVEEEGSLVLHTSEYYSGEHRIDVRTEHEVKGIDPGGRAVEVASLLTGEKTALSYHKLIIASGARAVSPNIPGLALAGVFSLRSLEGGVATKQFIRARGVRRAAIIGAGYIGLEMAESLYAAGAAVTLVEASDNVMPGSDPEISQLIEEELKQHQVEVRKQQLALSFEPNAEGTVTRVVTDQGNVEADLVVVAAGARPNVVIAREAGIALGETRAIATDEMMRTNIPDIYAAGDCVETRHLVSGRPFYLPLGTTATKQGRVAGENAAGGRATFPGVVGSSALKMFDLEVARTGLSTEQAALAGFEPVGALTHFPSHPRFYPGAETLTVKLVADRRNGRLLGAQMVGRGTVAKRIDVVATALQARMTVADILRLDLTAGPPFATVWEGIQRAAQTLQGQVVD